MTRAEKRAEKSGGALYKLSKTQRLAIQVKYALVKDTGSLRMTYLDPSEAQVACFMATQQDDQPVAMLNLLRYRERAAYAVGDEGEGSSGREAYARYARLALPCIQAVGGEVVWQGQGRMTLIGPESEGWDDMFIVHYPSPKSFVVMINDPEYQAIAFHRKAALADSRLMAFIPGAASFQQR